MPVQPALWRTFAGDVRGLSEADEEQALPLC